MKKVGSCHNVATMEPMQQRGFIPEFDLSDRLRKARKTTGLDIREFAEKTGISKATVTNAESGKNKPFKNTIKIWALATGVDYEWLLNGTTPPPEDGEGVAEPGAPSQIRTDDLFFTREMLYP